MQQQIPDPTKPIGVLVCHEPYLSVEWVDFENARWSQGGDETAKHTTEWMTREEFDAIVRPRLTPQDEERWEESGYAIMEDLERVAGGWKILFRSGEDSFGQ